METSLIIVTATLSLIVSVVSGADLCEYQPGNLGLLSRGAMQARYNATAVLSVCPSVTLVYSFEIAKHITKRFIRHHTLPFV